MSHKVRLALLAGALAMSPAAALAQEVGETIYGADGHPVGRVVELNDRVVVIDTGRHQARVPTNLLFDGAKGKSVNATRERLDDMMDERVADNGSKRDAALTQNAPSPGRSL
jgi:hypothetical protein